MFAVAMQTSTGTKNLKIAGCWSKYKQRLTINSDSHCSEQYKNIYESVAGEENGHFFLFVCKAYNYCDDE